jgi:hypothetical protein
MIVMEKTMKHGNKTKIYLVTIAVLVVIGSCGTAEAAAQKKNTTVSTLDPFTLVIGTASNDSSSSSSASIGTAPSSTGSSQTPSSTSSDTGVPSTTATPPVADTATPSASAGSSDTTQSDPLVMVPGRHARPWVIIPYEPALRSPCKPNW